MDARIALSLIAWELLTGGDSLLTEPALSMHGATRHRFKQLRSMWATQVPAPVVALAEQRLTEAGITEPLRLSLTRRVDGSWTSPQDETAASKVGPAYGPLALAPPEAIADLLAQSSNTFSHSLEADLRLIVRVKRRGESKWVRDHRRLTVSRVRTAVGQDPDAKLCCLSCRSVMSFAQLVISGRDGGCASHSKSVPHSSKLEASGDAAKLISRTLIGSASRLPIATWALAAEGPFAAADAADAIGVKRDVIISEMSRMTQVGMIERDRPGNRATLYQRTDSPLWEIFKLVDQLF